MRFNDLKNIQKDFQLIDNHKLRYKLMTNYFFKFCKLQMIACDRLKKDRDAIMEEIDINLIRNISEKYRKVVPKDRYNKYLNVNNYLQRNLKRAYILNLHKSKSINILDIGAGAGYFCLACNYFGHNVTAMDVGEYPIFDELIELFEINRKIGAIDAFKKLPQFDTVFDLITAFYVPFNKASNPEEVWRVKKWRFLLDDLANNLLQENGKIFFFLHPEKDGKHYDKSLLKFFLDYNANVFGQELYFKDTKKLRHLNRS